MKLSIQLYTVRDLTAKDFAATVNQLAKIGYKAVELAGFGNLKTAAEAKKALDDAGIEASGLHATIEVLEKDLAKVLDDLQTLGTTNLICPWMPEERRKDAEGWKRAAKTLEKIGYQCHQTGVVFCYHNHSFEFKDFGGKTGLDILWENSAPHLVKSQLDVYWVKHGGADPVAYINKLGERVHLMHLKDMAKGEDKKFAPVGTGILDFKGIVDAATKAQTQWGAVEQDQTYELSPLDAAKISLENLKRLGLS